MFQINQYAIQTGRVFPIKPEQARALNEKRAEIYWTINNFSAWGRRTKPELREITGFYCEIDELDKSKQEEFLMRGPTPSCVVETKRGFQIHWYFKTPIDCSDAPEKWADWFRDFVVNRIVPVYGADTQAADACRLLRMPFYRYWKDGKGDFMIDIAFESDCFYTVEELEGFFPKIEKKEFQSPKRQVQSSGDETDDFWSKANRLDCRASLERLSGTEFVSMEKFTFKNMRDGTARIIIDGKPRNCWLDKNGLIGSTAEGGPAIPNWIFYYHRDWKRVAEILKQVFPELGHV